MPGGCNMEGVRVCGKRVDGGKDEGGSFECEESDIFMPRFVSPVKLSKLGLNFSSHLQGGHEIILLIGYIDKYNLYKDIVCSMAEAPL